MPEEKEMGIGKHLRKLRESKTLSQGDIERRSGLLRSYISRVEGGYTIPSLSTLEKFAKALDMEAYQLLFRGGGRPTAPKVPEHVGISKSTDRLVKLFGSMSTANRKLLLDLARKLGRK